MKKMRHNKSYRALAAFLSFTLIFFATPVVSVSTLIPGFASSPVAFAGADYPEGDIAKTMATQGVSQGEALLSDPEVTSGGDLFEPLDETDGISKSEIDTRKDEINARITKINDEFIPSIDGVQETLGFALPALEGQKTGAETQRNNANTQISGAITQVNSIINELTNSANPWQDQTVRNEMINRKPGLQAPAQDWINYLDWAIPRLEEEKQRAVNRKGDLQAQYDAMFEIVTVTETGNCGETTTYQERRLKAGYTQEQADALATQITALETWITKLDQRIPELGELKTQLSNLIESRLFWNQTITDTGTLIADVQDVSGRLVETRAALSAEALALGNEIKALSARADTLSVIDGLAVSATINDLLLRYGGRYSSAVPPPPTNNVILSQSGCEFVSDGSGDAVCDIEFSDTRTSGRNYVYTVYVPNPDVPAAASPSIKQISETFNGPFVHTIFLLESGAEFHQPIDGGINLTVDATLWLNPKYLANTDGPRVRITGMARIFLNDLTPNDIFDPVLVDEGRNAARLEAAANDFSGKVPDLHPGLSGRNLEVTNFTESSTEPGAFNITLNDGGPVYYYTVTDEFSSTAVTAALVNIKRIDSRWGSDRFAMFFGQDDGSQVYVPLYTSFLGSNNPNNIEILAVGTAIADLIARGENVPEYIHQSLNPEDRYEDFLRGPALLMLSDYDAGGGNISFKLSSGNFTYGYEVEEVPPGVFDVVDSSFGKAVNVAFAVIRDLIGQGVPWFSGFTRITSASLLPTPPSRPPYRYQVAVDTADNKAYDYFLEYPSSIDCPMATTPACIPAIDLNNPLKEAKIDSVRRFESAGNLTGLSFFERYNNENTDPVAVANRPYIYHRVDFSGPQISQVNSSSALNSLRAAGVGWTEAWNSILTPSTTDNPAWTIIDKSADYQVKLQLQGFEQKRDNLASEDFYNFDLLFTAQTSRVSPPDPRIDSNVRLVYTVRDQEPDTDFIAESYLWGVPAVGATFLKPNGIDLDNRPGVDNEFVTVYFGQPPLPGLNPVTSAGLDFPETVNAIETALIDLGQVRGELDFGTPPFAVPPHIDFTLVKLDIPNVTGNSRFYNFQLSRDDYLYDYRVEQNLTTDVYTVVPGSYKKSIDIARVVKQDFFSNRAGAPNQINEVIIGAPSQTPPHYPVRLVLNSARGNQTYEYTVKFSVLIDDPNIGNYTLAQAEIKTIDIFEQDGFKSEHMEIRIPPLNNILEVHTHYSRAFNEPVAVSYVVPRVPAPPTSQPRNKTIRIDFDFNLREGGATDLPAVIPAYTVTPSVLENAFIALITETGPEANRIDLRNAGTVGLRLTNYDHVGQTFEIETILAGPRQFQQQQYFADNNPDTHPGFLKNPGFIYRFNFSGSINYEKFINVNEMVKSDFSDFNDPLKPEKRNGNLDNILSMKREPWIFGYSVEVILADAFYKYFVFRDSNFDLATWGKTPIALIRQFDDDGRMIKEVWPRYYASPPAPPSPNPPGPESDLHWRYEIQYEFDPVSGAMTQMNWVGPKDSFFVNLVPSGIDFTDPARDKLRNAIEAALLDMIREPLNVTTAVPADDRFRPVRENAADESPSQVFVRETLILGGVEATDGGAVNLDLISDGRQNLVAPISGNPNRGKDPTDYQYRYHVSNLLNSNPVFPVNPPSVMVADLQARILDPQTAMENAARAVVLDDLNRRYALAANQVVPDPLSVDCVAANAICTIQVDRVTGNENYFYTLNMPGAQTAVIKTISEKSGSSEFNRILILESGAEFHQRVSGGAPSVDAEFWLVPKHLNNQITGRRVNLTGQARTFMNSGFDFTDGGRNIRRLETAARDFKDKMNARGGGPLYDLTGFVETAAGIIDLTLHTATSFSGIDYDYQYTYTLTEPDTIKHIDSFANAERIAMYFLRGSREVTIEFFEPYLGDTNGADIFAIEAAVDHLVSRESEILSTIANPYPMPPPPPNPVALSLVEHQSLAGGAAFKLASEYFVYSYGVAASGENYEVDEQAYRKEINVLYKAIRDVLTENGIGWPYGFSNIRFEGPLSAGSAPPYQYKVLMDTRPDPDSELNQSFEYILEYPSPISCPMTHSCIDDAGNPISMDDFDQPNPNNNDNPQEEIKFDSIKRFDIADGTRLLQEVSFFEYFPDSNNADGPDIYHRVDISGQRLSDLQVLDGAAGNEHSLNSLRAVGVSWANVWNNLSSIPNNPTTIIDRRDNYRIGLALQDFEKKRDNLSNVDFYNFDLLFQPNSRPPNPLSMQPPDPKINIDVRLIYTARVDPSGAAYTAESYVWGGNTPGGAGFLKPNGFDLDGAQNEVTIVYFNGLSEAQSQHLNPVTDSGFDFPETVNAVEIAVIDLDARGELVFAPDPPNGFKKELSLYKLDEPIDLGSGTRRYKFQLLSNTGSGNSDFIYRFQVDQDINPQSPTFDVYTVVPGSYNKTVNIAKKAIQDFNANRRGGYNDPQTLFIDNVIVDGPSRDPPQYPVTFELKRSTDPNFKETYTYVVEFPAAIDDGEAIAGPPPMTPNDATIKTIDIFERDGFKRKHIQIFNPAPFGILEYHTHYDRDFDVPTAASYIVPTTATPPSRKEIRIDFDFAVSGSDVAPNLAPYEPNLGILPFSITELIASGEIPGLANPSLKKYRLSNYSEANCADEAVCFELETVFDNVNLQAPSYLAEPGFIYRFEMDTGSGFIPVPRYIKYFNVNEIAKIDFVKPVPVGTRPDQTTRPEDSLFRLGSLDDIAGITRTFDMPSNEFKVTIKLNDTPGNESRYEYKINGAVDYIASYDNLTRVQSIDQYNADNKKVREIFFRNVYYDPAFEAGARENRYVGWNYRMHRFLNPDDQTLTRLAIASRWTGVPWFSIDLAHTDPLTNLETSAVDWTDSNFLQLPDALEAAAIDLKKRGDDNNNLPPLNRELPYYAAGETLALGDVAYFQNPTPQYTFTLESSGRAGRNPPSPDYINYYRVNDIFETVDRIDANLERRVPALVFPDRLRIANADLRGQSYPYEIRVDDHVEFYFTYDQSAERLNIHYGEMTITKTGVHADLIADSNNEGEPAVVFDFLLPGAERDIEIDGEADWVIEDLCGLGFAWCASNGTPSSKTWEFHFSPGLPDAFLRLWKDEEIWEEDLANDPLLEDGRYRVQRFRNRIFSDQQNRRGLTVEDQETIYRDNVANPEIGTVQYSKTENQYFNSAERQYLIRAYTRNWTKGVPGEVPPEERENQVFPEPATELRKFEDHLTDYHYVFSAGNVTKVSVRDTQVIREWANGGGGLQLGGTTLARGIHTNTFIEHLSSAAESPENPKRYLEVIRTFDQDAIQPVSSGKFYKEEGATRVINFASAGGEAGDPITSVDNAGVNPETGAFPSFDGWDVNKPGSVPPMTWLADFESKINAAADAELSFTGLAREHTNIDNIQAIEKAARYLRNPNENPNDVAPPVNFQSVDFTNGAPFVVTNFSPPADSVEAGRDIRTYTFRLNRTGEADLHAFTVKKDLETKIYTVTAYQLLQYVQVPPMKFGADRTQFTEVPYSIKICDNISNPVQRGQCANPLPSYPVDHLYTMNYVVDPETFDGTLTVVAGAQQYVLTGIGYQDMESSILAGTAFEFVISETPTVRKIWKFKFGHTEPAGTNGLRAPQRGDLYVSEWIQEEIYPNAIGSQVRNRIQTIAYDNAGYGVVTADETIIRSNTVNYSKETFDYQIIHDDSLTERDRLRGVLPPSAWHPGVDHLFLERSEKISYLSRNPALQPHADQANQLDRYESNVTDFRYIFNWGNLAVSTRNHVEKRNWDIGTGSLSSGGPSNNWRTRTEEKHHYDGHMDPFFRLRPEDDAQTLRVNQVTNQVRDLLGNVTTTVKNDGYYLTDYRERTPVNGSIPSHTQWFYATDTPVPLVAITNGWFGNAAPNRVTGSDGVERTSYAWGGPVNAGLGIPATDTPGLYDDLLIIERFADVHTNKFYDQNIENKNYDPDHYIPPAFLNDPSLWSNPAVENPGRGLGFEMRVCDEYHATQTQSCILYDEDDNFVWSGETVNINARENGRIIQEAIRNGDEGWPLMVGGLQSDYVAKSVRRRPGWTASTEAEYIQEIAPAVLRDVNGNGRIDANTEEIRDINGDGVVNQIDVDAANLNARGIPNAFIDGNDRVLIKIDESFDPANPEASAFQGIEVNGIPDKIYASYEGAYEDSWARDTFFGGCDGVVEEDDDDGGIFSMGGSRTPIINRSTKMPKAGAKFLDFGLVIQGNGGGYVSEGAPVGTAPDSITVAVLKYYQKSNNPNHPEYLITFTDPARGNAPIQVPLKAPDGFVKLFTVSITRDGEIKFDDVMPPPTSLSGTMAFSVATLSADSTEESRAPPPADATVDPVSLFSTGDASNGLWFGGIGTISSGTQTPGQLALNAQTEPSLMPVCGTSLGADAELNSYSPANPVDNNLSLQVDIDGAEVIENDEPELFESGDLSGDGVVDSNDLNLFGIGDLNGDGVIDMRDLNLSENPPVPSPEPAPAPQPVTSPVLSINSLASLLPKISLPTYSRSLSFSNTSTMMMRSTVISPLLLTLVTGTSAGTADRVTLELEISSAETSGSTSTEGGIMTNLSPPSASLTSAELFRQPVFFDTRILYSTRLSNTSKSMRSLEWSRLNDLRRILGLNQ